MPRTLRMKAVGLSLLIAIGIAGISAAFGAGSSSDRIALIIANSAYEHDPLDNTFSDGSLIANTLLNFGFDVDFRHNLDLGAMKDAVRTFGDRLSGPNTVGFFYYAGHAIQIRGTNYLIPIGATIEREHEVESEAFDVGRILTLYKYSGNRLNIAVLDACRNNPFRSLFRSGGRGLSGVAAPGGSLVAFATAPGDIAADDGSYARSLAGHIVTPGLPLESVFRNVARDINQSSGRRQVPWYQSSVTVEFSFASEPGATRSDNRAEIRTAALPEPAPVQENHYDRSGNDPAIRLCYVDDVRPPDDWLALRTEPSTRAGRTLRRLPSGTAMAMLGRQEGNWHYVETTDNRETGWVSWAKSRWIRCP